MLQHLCFCILLFTHLAVNKKQVVAWLLTDISVSCRGKTNFFEKRVGDYQKSGVMAGLSNTNQHTIAFDEDF